MKRFDYSEIKDRYCYDEYVGSDVSPYSLKNALNSFSLYCDDNKLPYTFTEFKKYISKQIKNIVETRKYLQMNFIVKYLDNIDPLALLDYQLIELAELKENAIPMTENEVKTFCQYEQILGHLERKLNTKDILKIVLSQSTDLNDLKKYDDMLIQESKQIESSNTDKVYIMSRTNKEGVVTQSVNKPLMTQYMIDNYNIANYQGQMRVYMNGYYKLIDFKEVSYNELPINLRCSKIANHIQENLLLDNQIKLLHSELASDRYISFNNGVLDTATMELLPHSEDLKFISQIPYNYNPEAGECPYFKAFMDNSVGDDEELRTFLLEIIGYVISDVRSMKKILYLNGEKDTGKSTYCNILKQMLTNGNEVQYSSVPLSELTKDDSPHTHNIMGSKVNFDTDVNINTIIKNDSLIKKASGGGNETIEANRKYLPPVRGVLKTFLIFAGNGHLKMWLNGHQNALVDRLIPVTFTRVVPVEKQIPNLEDKINYEYVIKIAVENFINLKNRGFKLIEPKAVTETREEIRRESDIFYDFKNSCIVECAGSELVQANIHNQLIDVFNKWQLETHGEIVQMTNTTLTQGFKRIFGINSFKKNANSKLTAGKRYNTYKGYKYNDECFKMLHYIDNEKQKMLFLKPHSRDNY